ncbi:IGF-like family receptor 1 [Pungitius pungitius]|uniref:IGF-like family receptor 1 n=1 Tax=Pungitius pungitius TaxID=134920 RepID=UPI001888537C|nr:IGF-like family receptor 1 [Pungitius pungitius]
MGHSERCQDLDTYFDKVSLECKQCPPIPGHGITPNCGYDDQGGRHEPPHKECKNGTFNDGRSAHCKPCARCPPGFIYASPCNTTSDTECQAPRGTTGHPLTIQTKPNQATAPTPSPPEAPGAGIIWALAFAIFIGIALGVVCACLFWRRRKRGQHGALGYPRRSINSGFSPLSAPPHSNDSGHVLSPDIQSAPLQTVLDNLDVLEELVVLLDPENQGVKNTKHLASHCSFPATWITYIYSMKESKSPLKAVLEAVSSRHPDWTVGHLAERLKLMERNDAIAVLSKLGVSVMQV